MTQGNLIVTFVIQRKIYPVLILISTFRFVQLQQTKLNNLLKSLIDDHRNRCVQQHRNNNLMSEQTARGQ